MKITIDYIQIMLKEYELLNEKVTNYSKRMFRVLIGVGGGAIAFFWYGIQKPESIHKLSFLSILLLHAATISLLHSHFTILTLKKALRLISDRINNSSPTMVLIWERQVWKEHWGGIDNLYKPLSWFLFSLLFIPLIIAYFYLVPNGNDFLKSHFPNNNLLYNCYFIVMILFPILEILIPICIGSKLTEPFNAIKENDLIETKKDLKT